MDSRGAFANKAPALWFVQQINLARSMVFPTGTGTATGTTPREEKEKQHVDRTGNKERYVRH